MSHSAFLLAGCDFADRCGKKTWASLHFQWCDSSGKCNPRAGSLEAQNNAKTWKNFYNTSFSQLHLSVAQQSKDQRETLPGRVGSSSIPLHTAEPPVLSPMAACCHGWCPLSESPASEMEPVPMHQPVLLSPPWAARGPLGMVNLLGSVRYLGGTHGWRGAQGSHPPMVALCPGSL